MLSSYTKNREDNNNLLLSIGRENHCAPRSLTAFGYVLAKTLLRVGGTAERRNTGDGGNHVGNAPFGDDSTALVYGGGNYNIIILRRSMCGGRIVLCTTPV